MHKVRLCVALLLALVFVGSMRPALAALTCGAKPEIVPADVVGKIKEDATGNANVILRAAPRVNLRNLVTAQRRELRLKYAQVEKETLDHYLLWVLCQTISNDPDRGAVQQFDDYANVYRLMSEPLEKGAPPPE